MSIALTTLHHYSKKYSNCPWYINGGYWSNTLEWTISTNHHHQQVWSMTMGSYFYQSGFSLVKVNAPVHGFYRVIGQLNNYKVNHLHNYRPRTVKYCFHRYLSVNRGAGVPRPGPNWGEGVPQGTCPPSQGTYPLARYWQGGGGSPSPQGTYPPGQSIYPSQVSTGGYPKVPIPQPRYLPPPHPPARSWQYPKVPTPPPPPPARSGRGERIPQGTYPPG